MIIKELLDLGLNQTFIDEVLNSKKYHKVVSDCYFDIRNPKNKEIALKLYEEYKIPNYKIAMLSGISEATNKKILTSYGFTNRGHRVGKNSDNTYFEHIDTPDKAYFLGFIYADGSVQDLSTETNDKKTLSLTITEGDRYLLQNFLRYSGIQATIYITHKEDPKPRAQINIHSCKLYDDLYSLGVKPNKSKKEIYLELPELSTQLIPHFIRGYFDGDGIAFSDKKLGFCGNKQVLEYIRKNLFAYIALDGNPQITYNESNRIYYLVFGVRDSSKIADFLYQDKQDLYLQRKYDIYRPM